MLLSQIRIAHLRWESLYLLGGRGFPSMVKKKEVIYSGGLGNPQNPSCFSSSRRKLSSKIYMLSRLKLIKLNIAGKRRSVRRLRVCFVYVCRANVCHIQKCCH